MSNSQEIKGLNSEGVLAGRFPWNITHSAPETTTLPPSHLQRAHHPRLVTRTGEPFFSLP